MRVAKYTIIVLTALIFLLSCQDDYNPLDAYVPEVPRPIKKYEGELIEIVNPANRAFTITSVAYKDVNDIYIAAIIKNYNEGEDYYSIIEAALYHFDGDNIKEISLIGVIPEGYDHTRIEKLQIDENGNLWLWYKYYNYETSGGGHNLIMLNNGSFLNKISFDINYVMDVYIENQNNIYASSYRESIGYYDGTEWTVYKVPFEEEDLKEIRVFQIIKYHNQIFTTMELKYPDYRDHWRLVTFNNGEWEIIERTADYNDKDYPWGVASFFITKNGVLMSTGGGIFKWNGSKFEMLFDYDYSWDNPISCIHSTEFAFISDQKVYYYNDGESGQIEIADAPNEAVYVQPVLSDTSLIIIGTRGSAFYGGYTNMFIYNGTPKQ